MSDPYNLKEYIRTVDDFPIDGIKFRDITSLIETPEAFIKTCDELTRITKEFGANIVASIESRGFIFAGTIARDLELPFVLARKPGKLPNQTYKKSFDLEYGSTSIEIQQNTNVNKDQKIVIVDDLVATGGTAIADRKQKIPPHARGETGNEGINRYRRQSYRAPCARTALRARGSVSG